MQSFKSGRATRLLKVLVLAEQESEDGAVAAFLLARRQMNKLGVNLGSLVRSKHVPPAGVHVDAYKRLVKILSLSASDREGESIAAFLMARRLMDRLGLTFEVILELPAETETAGDRYAKSYPSAGMEVVALRKKVQSLQSELAMKAEQLKRYENAFEEMVENTWALHQPQAQTNLLDAPSTH